MISPRASLLVLAIIAGATASCAGDTVQAPRVAAGFADVPLSDGTLSLPLGTRIARHDDMVVLRLSASWCAACTWHLEHDEALLPAKANTYVRYVDVLLRGPDNSLPTASDLHSLRARRGSGAQAYSDPSLALYTQAAKFNDAHHLTLPAYVLLDGRTLSPRMVLQSPDTTTLAYVLRTELQELTGRGFATVTTPADKRGLEQNVAALLQGMSVRYTPISDPSNRYADNTEVAQLGKELFNDPSLSPSGKTSCASCHDANHGFADPRSVSLEAGTGTRNAPSLLTAGRRTHFFWDGRSDALWTQALAPFENDAEFASARGLVVARAVSRGAAAWAQTFAEAPWLPRELAQVAPDARPGRPSWTSLSAPLKERVNRSYVNVGKAIAAYERTLRTKPTRFDAYLEGDTQALSAQERDGMARFVINGCAQCHSGPDLTDDAYHVVRFPSAAGAMDVGRIAGVEAAARAEFTTHGTWSDAVAPTKATPATVRETHLRGAFKTPSLRAVADTAPYGHAGNLATLEDVLTIYANGDHAPEDPRAVGVREPWISHFHENEIPAMAAFLRVFTEK